MTRDDAPILGPRSIVRRRASDPRAGVGAAGYALALQVGHPTIAAGVRDPHVLWRDLRNICA